jgi:aminoglycoside phosphotransferase (APT) family kinase protein
MDEDGWRTCLRWVVVHPHDPAVLAARRDGALALPETERPGQVWTADPAEVLPALDELLGADALLLDCLDDQQDPAARVQRATLLAVPRRTSAPPQGMAWVGRDGLAGADAALAARVVEALGRGPAGDGGQPWLARGWFAEAEGWLRSAMERLGRPVTGTVRQARVWRLSCVLRAPTAGGDVWFKANTTSPLFVNEGVVMGALAGLFPGQVPAPLAVEPDRGWMVLADFGEEVGWEAPLEVVEEVARSYARMQVEAAGQVGRLLDAGCLDRRLDRLAAQAQAWLPAVEATAELPGIDSATWLSPEEEAGLRAAVPRLQARCAELAGYAVPPSIVHGDLHLSNVARGPKGYLFFDWTDACVAHPFLDLATIRRGTGFVDATDEAELRERLRRAYLPEWAAFEPPRRLAEAWELAAPLGALHQAVSYRSLAARPPGDPHMAQSTAWWLRQVLAGLA